MPWFASRLFRTTLVVVLVAVLVVLALWGIVVSRRDVLDYRIAQRFPWPIACSLRGCITTSAWYTHMQVRTAFAEASGQAMPSTTHALTTLVRQHLVRNAFLRVPVGEEDAVRYREEVLNVHDAAAVLDATGLTMDDYDASVTLPLLQQEALRQERRVETLEELFALLADERPLIVFARTLKWDSQSATVVER